MKIEIQKVSEEDLEKKDVKSWPIWKKEISRFDWYYDDTEECYLLAGKVIVETVVREILSERFISAIEPLDTEKLKCLLGLIEYSDGFSYGKEVQLARSLQNHEDAGIREWAQARVPAVPKQKAKSSYPPFLFGQQQ